MKRNVHRKKPQSEVILFKNYDCQFVLSTSTSTAMWMEGVLYRQTKVLNQKIFHTATSKRDTALKIFRSYSMHDRSECDQYLLSAVLLIYNNKVPIRQVLHLTWHPKCTCVLEYPVHRLEWPRRSIRLTAATVDPVLQAAASTSFLPSKPFHFSVANLLGPWHLPPTS